jgi:hypothetical protein
LYLGRRKYTTPPPGPGRRIVFLISLEGKSATLEETRICTAIGIEDPVGIAFTSIPLRITRFAAARQVVNDY